MAGHYTLDVIELQKQRSGGGKQPFPHQHEAFSALSKTLTLPVEGYKGTLLVLPTGSGKTGSSGSYVASCQEKKYLEDFFLVSHYILGA